MAPDSTLVRHLEKLEDSIKLVDSDLRDVAADVQVLKSQIDAVKEQFDKFVTRHEFTPVKLLVYGLTGSTLAGVVGAIMSKVLTK